MFTLRGALEAVRDMIAKTRITRGSISDLCFSSLAYCHYLGIGLHLHAVLPELLRGAHSPRQSQRGLRRHERPHDRQNQTGYRLGSYQQRRKCEARL